MIYFYSDGSQDNPNEFLMQVLTSLSLEESRALVHRFLERVVDIRGERAPKDMELQVKTCSGRASPAYAVYGKGQ